MNKCPVCGANCEGGACWRHKSRKPLKKSNITPKKRENAGNNQQMKEFFLEIWRERPHVSEVSGEKLFGEPSSTYFHHILEKNMVPEAKYDKSNIILLLTQEHEQVHLDKFRYEEINKRREQLLIKYNKL